MVKLAKFAYFCFGIGALTFAWEALLGLRDLRLRALTENSWPTTRETLSIGILSAAAVVFGMACWTMWKGRASARVWALSASILTLLLGGVPAVIILSKAREFVSASTGGDLVYLSLGLLLVVVFGMGIAELFAFGLSEVPPLTLDRTSKPARIPGDGTSRITDVVAWLIGTVSTIAALEWLWQWGASNGLPATHWFWLELVIAMLISIVAHEFGHVVAGRALGMKLRAFTVGPFEWSVFRGKWKFGLRTGGSLWVGGSAGLVPGRREWPCWHDVVMIVAGPLASLCLGLTALSGTLTAQGQFWEPAWEVLAIIGVISTTAFAANLLPFRAGPYYSDGALIYQILSGSPCADVRRAFSIVTSSTVTALRPRDYDIAAVQRAADFLTSGREALLLRLFASAYFFDLGRRSEAAQAMAEAESVYEQSASDVRAELLTEFVFGNAFLKRDAGRARLWWDRMEVRKPKQDLVDYWLARCALLWIENNLEEAGEAWRKANALAEQLPKAGGYEFDRYRVKQLRQVLDAAIRG